jgi:hypothetical protein
VTRNDDDDDNDNNNDNISVKLWGSEVVRAIEREAESIL